MSENDPGMTALDARLRRLMAGLDVREGFDERLRARIAAAAPAHAELVAALEARRTAVRRRLRRAAWTNGATLAGVGIAASALAWRFMPEIGRWAAGIALPGDPLAITGATLAVLAFALWPLLRTMPGLRLR